MTEQYIEELIQKYADGSASDEEIQLLTRWYRLARIEDVQWPSVNAAEKEDLHRRMLEGIQNEISPKTAPVLNFPWLRVAAILVFFIGAASVMLYYLRPVATYITVKNPPGKIQLISLPDRSQVWLNASTTLRYSKSFHENRKVQLDGEAYFNVTHDTSHPFTISAGGVQTIVLGTSFNVKAYGSANTTTISVVSGRVKVAQNSKELGLLTPSVQLQFNRQLQTTKIIAIDTNAVIAWNKGRLQFQGESLEEIGATIENWYGIKIIFENPGMRSCRYYMNFNSSISIEKLLSTMSEITEMKYAIDKKSNTVTLSGKACQ